MTCPARGARAPYDRCGLDADAAQASVPQLAHLPDGATGPEEEKIDASRVVRELGLQYTPLDRTLVDMAESLIKLGLAVPGGAAVAPPPPP